MSGRVIAVCVSARRGIQKSPVDSGRLVRGHGLENDAHGGPWHRQVSLLANESADKMRAKGLDVGPGSFAENLTTEGIELVSLPIGKRLHIGGQAVLEITQIGKECHAHCAIYQQAGECVMPTEGVFARVVEGGEVRPGDPIELIAAAKEPIT